MRLFTETVRFSDVPGAVLHVKRWKCDLYMHSLHQTGNDVVIVWRFDIFEDYVEFCSRRVWYEPISRDAFINDEHAPLAWGLPK